MDLSHIKGIAVIGLGKMGADWVAQFLEGGYIVYGYDTSSDALQTVQTRLEKALTWIQKNREHPADFVASALSRFHLCTSQQDLLEHQSHYQILLEAIFEDMDQKCKLLQTMVPKHDSSMIYWSNTSSLDVERMALAGGNPATFIGTHGMNPVYMMPAVEVVRHNQLDQKTLDLTLELLHTKLNKIPFVASNVTGFWVNKMLVPLMLEGIRALERGEITVEDGDKGLKHSLGYPQGVFLLCDYVGVDTMYRVAMAMYLATQDARYYPPVILGKLFKRGELGLKTGQGFYHWEDGKPIHGRSFEPDQIISTDNLL